MRHTTSELIKQDLQHFWHPLSQMKDYEAFTPLCVQSASGSHFYLANGEPMIDATSSWWCKSLGHNHPRLKRALFAQCEQYEHVIAANTTQAITTRLAEKLCQLSPSLNKVFFAGDGACAVEIALKMSCQAAAQRGESQRTQFISLEHAYHGDTIGALSVSDLPLYNKPFASLTFHCHKITDLPYICGRHDPDWQDCAIAWEKIEKRLQPYANTACALIVEPMVQGGCGMLLYSPDLLRRLRAWTQANNVYLIADEIMTGLGRTGAMFASEHAGIEADFVCLGKGLSAGWMPLSAVLCRDEIYDLFYDDYDTGKGFMHSHTYAGNALGAAVALEALAIIEEEQLCHRARELENIMHTKMLAIAAQTQKIHNVRSLGAICAADLIVDEQQQRLGYQVFQAAIAKGAWLRPLGNTLYWLPPLNIELSTLDQLAEITKEAILAAA